MKKLFALCCLCMMFAVAAHAEDKAKTAKGEAGMDQQQMMEMMAKAATPGPQHAMLTAMAGEWDQKVSYQMDPAQPMQTAMASATVKAIMGGRYIQEESTGEMMGMPFNGMGITGYDNVTKKFVSTWIDNMGTGIMTSEGTADATGKIITWNGQMSDPMTGKVSKSRMVATLTDDDHHTFEMFGKAPNGKEMKMMTIEYTRKGGSAAN
jgi:hypothetical protein